MAAYVIVQVEVTDWERFREYLKEVPRILNQYGGKYLACGGETILLEGPDQSQRVVLIEFPSLQQARDWYHSPEYLQIKSLRAGAAHGTITAIEGC